MRTPDAPSKGRIIHAEGEVSQRNKINEGAFLAQKFPISSLPLRLSELRVKS